MVCALANGLSQCRSRLVRLAPKNRWPISAWPPTIQAGHWQLRVDSAQSYSLVVKHSSGSGGESSFAFPTGPPYAQRDCAKGNGVQPLPSGLDGSIQIAKVVTPSDRKIARLSRARAGFPTESSASNLPILEDHRFMGECRIGGLTPVSETPRLTHV